MAKTATSPPAIATRSNPSSRFSSWRGFAPLLVSAGAIFAILSLITAGSGAKPRHELKRLEGLERVAIAGALVAVFAIHASGLLWASARLEDWQSYEKLRQERRLDASERNAFLLPGTMPERRL